jgi:redox-sensitive bicupin YhaK (pirin superfamily)
VDVAQPPVADLLPGHEVPIGRYTMVRRLLPHRQRRMVGAWCFLDHFGPDAVAAGPGMRVPPHPHIGLQTVTWLVDGEILHRDSLGNRQAIRPGQLNLMTAGHGIAHSEESPYPRPPALHGLQLWIALPLAGAAAGFAHHTTLPVVREAGATATVVVGSLGGAVSPALVHTPLLGVDAALTGPARLPLEPGFEHAVVVLSGRVRVGGAVLEPGALLYLGRDRPDLLLEPETATARVFLLGGEPFEERLVMWWNFVGRSHEEIVRAREDWEASRDGWAAGRRFGPVPGYDGDALAAPAMPSTRLRSRDRHGHTSG